MYSDIILREMKSANITDVEYWYVFLIHMHLTTYKPSMETILAHVCNRYK